MPGKNQNQEKKFKENKENDIKKVDDNFNFNNKNKHYHQKTSNPLIFLSWFIILILIGFLFYDNVWPLIDINLFKNNPKETDPKYDYQIPLGISYELEKQKEPPQDPTISWKTFQFIIETTTTTSTEAAFLTETSSTNQILYSFKYPEDLLTVEKNGNLVKLISTATSSEFQLLINFEDYAGDLMDWLKKQDKISAKAWEGKPSIEVVTSSEATFIKLPALIRQEKMLAAGMMSYSLYFKKDGKIFTISMIAPELTQEMINFYLIFVNNFKF